jgi:hypothetical protein
MKFKLAKISENRSVTKFRITDEAQGVVGSVTVPRSQADDLLRHWAGPTGNPPAAKQGMAAALIANKRKVSRAAILRGSG